MKKTGPVAIIGAGLSGLSCAQALQAAGVSVRVFERAPVVGGRCATQLWQGHLVDLGVQYFTAQSGEFKKELLTRLRQFRPIVSPVLNENNQAIPNSLGPRFYVLQGNNYFTHILSHGLDIHLNTPVETVTFQSSGIECLGETYQAVVSSLPGPQTAQLFALPHSPADYEPCLVALLEYAGTNVGRSHECYGRVLAGCEPIRASYCENNKVGRIIGNKTVFVVEAAPHYSREHGHEHSETYLPDLIRKHEEIWGIPAGNRTAAYGHCWNYARPLPGRNDPVDLPPGGFICGDSRTDSAVENVWLDGRKAAQEVLSYLAR
ncbi:MAG: FAD-dependent oxidoreductase [Methylacidiphilales bacterium]|nr:FAD-dependent oxidoreductase [Candidatus Methylacidiphilales bacterium]